MSMETSWNSFLVNLKATADIWGTDAARIRQVSTSAKSKFLGIDRENKNNTTCLTVTNETGSKSPGKNIAGNAVRKEELSLMLVEDKRRKMFMKQKELEQSQLRLNAQLNMSDAKGVTILADARLSQPFKLESKLGNSSSLKPRAVSAEIKAQLLLNQFEAPKDVDTAFKGLSSYRQFHLVDAFSKTLFYFYLIKETDEMFSLIWKEKINSAKVISCFLSLDIMLSISIYLDLYHIFSLV